MMKKQAALLAVALMVVLSGCGKNADNGKADSPASTVASNHGDSHSHAGMEHSGSGELPAGLKDAANPSFAVGSKAILETDHMPGMKGAEATIAGAYETTVYSVSYDPTTGGDRVTNHKWVIHEELKDAGQAAYAPGAEVILVADHMKGMDGAAATVDSAEQTIVYMVDYTPTTGGEPVRNHQWVTENELAKP
jgi:hypothetical protein